MTNGTEMASNEELVNQIIADLGNDSILEYANKYMPEAVGQNLGTAFSMVMVAGIKTGKTAEEVVDDYTNELNKVLRLGLAHPETRQVMDLLTGLIGVGIKLKEAAAKREPSAADFVELLKGFASTQGTDTPSTTERGTEASTELPTASESTTEVELPRRRRTR